MIGTRWMLALIGLFLLVAGARLWLIAGFGSALPIFDQWDGEGANLFKPWIDGTLRLADFFHPHNEHRIVVTRLLALALLQLNGQWDSLLEMAVNAGICGLIAVVVAALLAHIFEAAHRPGILVAVALWFALPYGLENTLWAFQSSFYFLLIFSIIAIWGLGLHRFATIKWWAGVAALCLASLSAASGFLAAVPVAVLSVARVAKKRATIRETVVTSSLAVVVIAASIYFRATVPYHEILKASSPLAWLTMFGRCLAWPFCDTAIVCLALYLPLALLATSYFSSRSTGKDPRPLRQMEILLGVGGWVILQAAAIAYVRGGDGRGLLASRYMEILALGTITNLLAAVTLVGRAPHALYRRLGLIGCSIWTMAVLIGACTLSWQIVASQSNRKGYLVQAEQDVRAYVSTGERKYLEGEPQPPIPYPNAARLATILDDKSIRSILPATVRLPLAVDERREQGAAFVPNGLPPEIQIPAGSRIWGSYSGLGPAARGRMESQPLYPKLHYLQFEVAGYLREGLSLEVQDGQTGKKTRVIPTLRRDQNWRTAYVPLPNHPVHIVAVDESASEWFAYREPTELGRLSFYAARLIASGKLMFGCGLALWLALVLQTYVRRRTASNVTATTREAGAQAGPHWSLRHIWLVRSFLVALAILPGIFILGMVLRYGVDIPYSDEWTYAPLLVKARAHTLTFTDLFEQHNEHRCFFPKVVLIAFSYFAGGNVRAEMVFSVALCALASCNLWFIIRRTLSLTIEKTLLVLTLFNLLLFSAVQAENWTWGFQFLAFLMNFLLTSGIAAVVSGLSVTKKFLICLAIALVGTFSFGSGVVLWLTTFPIALLRDRLRAKKSLGWLAAWVGAGMASLALYFFHYIKPLHHPEVAASANPTDYLLYVATFLGAHLSKAVGNEAIWWPATIGAALTILYFLGTWLFVASREEMLRKKMVPWIGMGAFAISSAILASLVRIGFGIPQALDSRYTTFSLSLSIGVIGMFAALGETLPSSSRSDRSFFGWLSRIRIVLLALLLIAYVRSSIWGAQSIQSTERARLWGKAAVLWGNILNDAPVYETHLGGWAPDVLRYANMENGIALLHPPMIRTAELSRMGPVPFSTRSTLGFLDTLDLSDGHCLVSGWAASPKGRRVADCVIVAYDSAERGPIAFGVTDEVVARTDVARSLHRKELVGSGWRVHFDRSVLPAGPQQITAWAFDAKTGKLYQLGGRQELP